MKNKHMKVKTVKDKVKDKRALTKFEQREILSKASNGSKKRKAQ